MPHQHDVRYKDEVRHPKFRGNLYVPMVPPPRDHVTLTLTIRYTLNFADSQQGATRANPPILVWYMGKCHARDSDGDLHEVTDWDFASQRNFQKRFKDGEKFWDDRFYLRTPDYFDGFDYPGIVNGRRVTLRPNVRCRFKLEGGVEFLREEDNIAKAHLTYDVVRLRRRPFWNRFWEGGGVDFRENASLLLDVATVRTIRHELGHNLGQEHIQALLGNGACKWEGIDGHDDYCYDTPATMEEENVMGRGEGVILANADPWMLSMAHLTEQSDRRKLDWHPSHSYIPPRIIE